jgi:hypothetical protein
VADERVRVSWRDIWPVVNASAERRLGKPLLVVYLVLAVAGAVAALARLVPPLV